MNMNNCCNNTIDDLKAEIAYYIWKQDDVFTIDSILQYLQTSKSSVVLGVSENTIKETVITIIRLFTSAGRLARIEDGYLYI